MSTARRLISGSAAAWARIGVTMLSQVAVVPLYLHYWSADQFGVWLAIQGLLAFTTLADIALLNYVNFEFLRHGPEKKIEVEKLLSNCLPYSVLIGAVELLVVCLMIHFGWIDRLYGVGGGSVDRALVSDANLILLLLSVVWIVTGSVGGLFSRVLAPFGLYSRIAWWNVLEAAFVTAAPAIAVASGGSFRQAGLAFVVATLLMPMPMYVDIARTMKRMSIRILSPDLGEGAALVGRSMLVLVKMLLEITRQHGLRVVLAPMVGASQMASFSAMRTVANVALQGLGTITNPLLPELMRFLRQGDQSKTVLAMSTVWFVLLLGLVPAVVVLQIVAPEAFRLWTHGKLEFDPFLFAMISMSILVYALTQPAMAIVQGQNLLKVQMVLSSFTAIIMIGGLIVLVPSIGLTAAAAVLLLAELANLIGFVLAANRWMKANRLQWPHRTFGLSSVAVAIGCAALAGIALFPGRPVWVVVAVATVALVVVVLSFARSLPEVPGSHGLGKALAVLRPRARTP